MGDGERAMKGLVAAKVKMEKKIDEMSNFIENELQVKEIQGTQFKRRKREADEGGNDENPLASLKPQKVSELMQAMRSMIDAFTELTDKYNEKRNAEEAIADEEKVQNDQVEEEPEEVGQEDDEEAPTERPLETKGDDRDTNSEEVDPAGEPGDSMEVDVDPTPPTRRKAKRGPKRGHGNPEKRRRRRRRRRRF